MANVNFGSAENLVRIGLLSVFVAIMFLTGAAFAEASRMFFWMAVFILFLETFKLPSVSASNAAVAELILAVTMVIGGGRVLVLTLGKTFAAYHIFLILFILGALIICYAALKRLNSKK